MSAFIDKERANFGVELISKTLGISRSAYYHRAKERRSARQVSDKIHLQKIHKVHQANYEAYGYDRTWKAIKRSGHQVARSTVQRLMRENGIRGAKRRGKPWRTTKPDPKRNICPDLVDRNFTANRPNALWVADFTYIRTWERMVFFSFVIDVFSRMVVGWQLGTHMRTDLVQDALKMALRIRDPGADLALVHHSDRGSQYTSSTYTQTLADHGVLGSLGSTGDAYDNALAESFVDSYKTELIADRIWRTTGHLELATVEWVGWFNHDRLHSSLGYVPPAEFDQCFGDLAGTFTLPNSPSGSLGNAASTTNPLPLLST